MLFPKGKMEKECFMRKEKAKNHFLGKAGYVKLNCAQAVIKVFSDLFDVSDNDIDSFLAFAGGRAPQGRCGAYYAAHYLISRKYPSRASQIEQGFVEAAGSLNCRSIRSKRKLSCLGCVEKAVDLVEGGQV